MTETYVSNFEFRASNLSSKMGFSLMELLMVLTLAPIVFFSIYSNFSAGVRIWSTVVRQTPQEDLNIFYYKVKRDLENMVRCASVPFSGDKEEIDFASSIEARPELGGHHGIGQVRFFYDPAAKTINREVKDYSQLYRDTAGQLSVLLRDVSSFELSYLSLNQTGDEYFWSDSWAAEDGKLPLAVRLSFMSEQAVGRQERTVHIPVGGKIKVVG